MLVKGHPESVIRVDPGRPGALDRLGKCLASAEGHHHVPGFYESFKGGTTWAAGHLPGYQGWTGGIDVTQAALSPARCGAAPATARPCNLHGPPGRRAGRG
jgi:hypothetical protein